MVDTEEQQPEASNPIRTHEQLREQLTAQGYWVSTPLVTLPAHWLGYQHKAGQQCPEQVGLISS